MQYTRLENRSHLYKLKSKNRQMILRFVKFGFPGCKGSYPDCPENPDSKIAPCKHCPVLDEINQNGRGN